MLTLERDLESVLHVRLNKVKDSFLFGDNERRSAEGEEVKTPSVGRYRPQRPVYHG